MSAPLSPQQRFTTLRRSLEHIGRIQVDADTIYYNRGSVIIVAQGFLIVAASSLYSSDNPDPGIGLVLLAVLGCVLSVLWYFFEQRNQVYFTARGAVIEELEESLLEIAEELELEFPAFWTRVPSIVKCDARWNQLFSAPLISRTIIPWLFALSWLAVLFGVVGG